MSATVCASCKSPKVAHECGICQIPLCKKCEQRLEKNPFPFLPKVPDELKHRSYCAPCYFAKVEPVQSQYNRDIEKARQVFIFIKAKSEETRLLSRSEKPLRVIDCEDQKETVMRLAYQASQAGYNAVIDVVVEPKKVRNHGYQTSTWQGVGVPTMVDAERLNREMPQR